jgi:alkylation response protein AidB-like acyl-CoA dehydrogenase
VFAPTGTAVPEGDGYRVSGRWSFASGCEYSGWRMAGAIVPGSPRPLHCLLRADQTRIVDTWDACGLRGTGSHDFLVEDVLVPRARTFSLVTTTDRAFFGPAAAGIAAVSLGIARAAIDSFVATAKVKPLAGGGAVYTRSPLQRYLRDAQVVAQYIMVGSLVTTTIGRILLDIESDTSTL